MLSQPLKVSILRSKFDIMGIHHNQKNYIIGFPCVAHAKEVQKFVGAHTKSYIQDYKMESFRMQRLHISKKININDVKCSLHTLELQDILTYPFLNNVGIVFALEMLDDFRDEFVFDCEYFDPFYNSDVFRESLKNKM
jgi:hypothetical protein